MSNPQRWFPNATNGVTVQLQQVFQRVLQLVYQNANNIATLQSQVPTTAFPLHFNSLGTVGTSAFNPATGDMFFCFQVNTWVRIGPSGISTTF